MNAEQYLNDFLSHRLPDSKSLSEFYEVAEEQKEELQQLANTIVELQTDAATPADHTRTQSYDALAEERANIVSNMELAGSRTERESRERRLDDIQREMEVENQTDSDKETEIGDKLSQLERITDSVVARM
ncbi:hypothetical protein U0358_07895 [Idiomarina sp. PL1-037]|uniref:hypothetical protein n=1 Tax=unclassified Idiomarina TaxID=2614829 RepID=UPI00294B3B76|nr:MULTISPECIES: hypothetical protein [unclassified Idiomarina]MDV6327132.1 hypothetical protein [Idiomarina sp. Sol25]WQC51980.1 hypothetical protein U0358_07895 [Idiomarina sp. PL1-037]